MKLFNYLLTVLFCIAVGACNDHQQMLSQLEELERQNLADSLMTNDSLALSLCDYFDSHGTPNERMRAHYMLARTYTDRGEAPQALEEFHTAISVVDTTAADCDYRRLARIHSQAAGLFYDCSLPNEMLHELSLQYKYGKMANDTLTWLFAVGSKSEAYYLLGKRDSAIVALQQAVKLYNQYGLETYAISWYPTLFFLLAEEGRYDEARHYIDIYECRSGYFDDGLPEEGFDNYYYAKGLYYTAIHKEDSAAFFFRQELRYSRTLNEQEGAYKGLYLLFKQQGIADSVAKYADLCYQTSEKNLEAMPVEGLQHLHALYNYSHNQKVAQEKTRESARLYHWLLVCFLLLVFVCSCIVVYVYKVKEKRKRRELEFHHQLELQEKAHNELSRLTKKEFSFLLGQKEQEITHHQNIIDKYQEELLSRKIVNTDVYKLFVKGGHENTEKVAEEDWNSLEEILARYLPGFKKWLDANLQRGELDYRICMLIRLHFAPMSISRLLDKSPQFLYSRRKKLHKDLFDTNGKPEEFDLKILKIK